MPGQRITCIIYSLGCGGAERVMVNLTGRLAGSGYHVTLLSLNPAIPDHYPVSPEVARISPPHAAIADCRWFDWRGQRRRRQALREAILATESDVVVSFLDTTNVAVLLALAGAGVPVVVAEHIDPRMHQIGWRWSLLRRLMYPRAARVVVLTQDTLRWARSLWPRWRLVAIPNSLEPSGAPLAATPPAGFGPRTLVAMGRLTPQKGFDLLIRAYAPLAGRFADWHLVILGEGEERPGLERLIAELGLQGRVFLPGVISTPDSVLPLADLFVVSSRYEGFCLALAEAMAAGLPVISFDCPSGPAEIVHDGVDGVLVPTGDVMALSAAMARLMADPAERQRLGQQARQVAERFSPERITDLWRRLIEEVLAETPSRRR